MPSEVNALPSEIANRYATLPQVVAIAVGGSRAASSFDTASDIDLYVYCNSEVPLSVRREIACRGASRCEVGLSFWEPGDLWIDAKTDTKVDVMLRDPAWIEGQIARVLDRHEASIGYSTAFWYNVSTSRVLHDPKGWFRDLQNRANGSYPEALRRNIVAKNYPILRQIITSYLHQLESAIARGDLVSVNHRIAAFLASYFDIIFAVNRVLHPGEKRLLSFALEHCRSVPAGFESGVTGFIKGGCDLDQTLLTHGHALVDGLETWLRKEGIEPQEILPWA